MSITIGRNLSVKFYHPKEDYKERVPATQFYRIIWSVVAGGLLSFFVLPLYYGTSTDPAKTFYSALFVLFGIITLHAIISVTHGIRIHYKFRRLMNGKMGYVLFIRGTEKGEQVDIICSDITAVHKVDYNNLDESDDAHIFRVSGYKGEGLCITVDYRVALTNESRTMIQVFPTRHADEVMQLLRAST